MVRSAVLAVGRHRGLGRRGLVAGLAAAAVVCASPAAAHAQGADFEVGPWLGWAAGVEWAGGRQRDVLSLNAGLDTTAAVSQLGGGYGGTVEVRLGPWVAFESPLDRKASGEGGLTMIVTQSRHASWGTYGLRVGAGHGADRATHLVATLWGGVRYVPMRAGEVPSGPIAKATGVRIVATYRTTVTPIEAAALVFGIEFEPEYFLPPYKLFKWGGKH